jgi:hypothetical protein
MDERDYENELATCAQYREEQESEWRAEVAASALKWRQARKARVREAIESGEVTASMANCSCPTFLGADHSKPCGICAETFLFGECI